MKNKRVKIFLIISFAFCLLLIILFYIQPNSPQYTPTHEQNDAKIENSGCLKCHGNKHYTMVKPSDNNKVIHGKMPREYRIDSNAYYNSSHWNFNCIDCHSEEYETAPHDPNLRFEEMQSCIDCHDEESDTTWIKFNFPTIEKDFTESIHTEDEEFSCYDCHNPHATMLALRNDSMPITQVVEVSNTMCTSCHSTSDKEFQREHDEFPHIDLHLKMVRCIDCHAQTNNSILIGHNIEKKKHATENCSECHSKNSKIITNIYLQRKNGTCEISSDSNIVKRNKQVPKMVGVYKNPIITYSVIGIISILLLVIISHFIWSITRKKDEN